MAMRPGVLLAGSAAMLTAVVACSTTAHPPPAEECIPSAEVPCTTRIIGGGSSGGGDGSAGSCTVNAGDSQCDQCAETSCCAELQKCAGLEACANLESCEDDCNDVGACLSACQQQYPTGVSTLRDLDACVTDKCVVCDESGVGDPCGSIYAPCEVGLGCNGSWCTKGCVRSTDCAGLGAGGTSSLGVPNVCMTTPNGDVCTPSCGAGGICSDFASTFCLATTAADGTAVSVCSFLPEASTTD
jgi:hypothetical protein